MFGIEEEFIFLKPATPSTRSETATTSLRCGPGPVNSTRLTEHDS